MELQISKHAAEYRLVFFQPDPEDGERLCIGLLFFEVDKRRSLVYDAGFARVRCIAPNFEIDLLRFLMTSLNDYLKNRDVSTEEALAAFGSQLALSGERSVASPISDATKMRLLERFVIRKAPKPPASTSAEKDSPSDTRFAEHLMSFARPLLSNANRRFITHADSSQVLGRKVAGVGTVTLLIGSEDRLTVLDGVDLSIQTPKEAINRTGKVAHTFWQYKRYAGEFVVPRKIDRVGVIFNGASNPKAGYRDAQGFARDILAERSEMLIEHDGAEDLSRLERLFLQ